MEEKTLLKNLPTNWKRRLSSEFEKDYFQELLTFLEREDRSGAQIFPDESNILRAIRSLDLPDVKVVILGQDPYHGTGQAVGLSFAVPNSCFPKPPSLKNIFKEINDDLGHSISEGHSDLSGWVNQGVLLLNAVLSVRKDQAFSHRDQGWEKFTDEVIRILNEREAPVIFLLWGAAAQKKKELIKNSWHFFLESAHPSPLSAYRGFLGNRHFSKTNALLRKLGRAEISWEKVSV